MQDATRFAFKEWAVVCEALHQGRQSLILRKGGIHEGREGFRVDHREFWLFPTAFHQQPDVLAEDARTLLSELGSQAASPGLIAIRNYVQVEEVIEVRDEALLGALTGLHIWSDSTISDRFHYRAPMLFVLLVRTYRLPTAIQIPESPHFAGCRSWVDLPGEIATSGLAPVLTDDEHHRQLETIRRRLTSSTTS
jgi:hypothetical protein